MASRNRCFFSTDTFFTVSAIQWASSLRTSFAGLFLKNSCKLFWAVNISVIHSFMPGCCPIIL